MVWFINASTHLLFSSPSNINCPNFPSLVFTIHPRRQQSVSLDLKESTSLGFPGFERRRSFGSPVLLFQRSSCSGLPLKRRSKGWEAEGNPALEAEILEFMQKSKNPNVFPSKKELIDAGRMDLVEGIAKQGGWLLLGWSLDEEETVQEDEFRIQGSNLRMVEKVDDGLLNSDTRIFQQRLDGGSGNDSLEGVEVGSTGVSSSPTCSSYPPSSSRRSIGMGHEDDAGIEGILSRLEKERNLSYGVGSREKESKGHVPRNDDEDDWRLRISAAAGSERSNRSMSLSPPNDLFNDSGGMHFKSGSFSDSDGMRNSLKPDTWRTWSIQRAGFSETEFEAAEIGEHDATNDEMVTKAANEMRNVRTELNSDDKDNDHNQIRSRLQHLELELASVLHLLRSHTDAVASDKSNESSTEELHKLSDAWEFQETEIMNARDKLRTTRAKLAVLEGKMALAIIEAQKMVDMKQKRIDNAQKSLSLLRTAYIVWPNSASEVRLAGSFDGWTSQRRMTRSSSGIFSLYLKLYPGQYEIKFIVDGVWTIDPLRPIVHNNGYNNNLLIIP